ncbi:hypothetical protein AB4Z48_03110 [Cupriavidus sp. 2TAF22]|uniref:hypothetical protein n=1 Tax=unclassified Cupriavidus TaxID=2640874 RepID=UPI003F910F2B
MFSVKYKGEVPIDAGLPQANFRSEFFRTQDEAELHLRLLAAERGFDLVAQRQYGSRQQQNGNYIFKAWQASGLAGFKAE